MAIDPRIPSVPGDFGGVAARLNDLDRRLRELSLQVGQAPAGAIQGTQIGSDSITSANIAANAITASEISAGAIYAGSIQAGAVTASSIAANAVTANAIAANSIYTNAIQANAVTAAQIAAGTITAAQISTGTITATQIAAGTITATQIAADTITSGQIAANAITASELAANSVYANALQANAVTASSIAANAVYANAIQAGAVDATKITVSSLASISSNMGSITAGTITGATIQTATSGARTIMDATGLRGYAVDGVSKVFEITGGVASFSGIGTLQAGSTVPGSVVTGTLSTSTIPPITNAMVSDLSATKLTGQITTTQVADDAISTPKLAVGSVTASRLAAGAVTTESLTVAALANSSAPNGGFEDVHPVDATLPAKWQRLSIFAATNLSSRASSAARSGGFGLRLAPGAGGAAEMTGSAYMPVTPSDVWHYSLWARKTGTGATSFYAGLEYRVDPATYTGTITWDLSTAADIPTTWTKYEGQVVIPAGQKFVVPMLLNFTPNTGGVVEVDDVEFRKVVVSAQIADGAITTPKMTVGSINADRLVAGTITATQIAANAVTATHIQAGAIKTHLLTIEFGGANMLLNSQAANATQGVSPWVQISAALSLSSTQAWEGSGSFKLVPSDTAAAYMTQTVSIKGGNWYTFSAYSYKPSASSGTPYVYINYLDSGGTVVSSTATAGATTANTWLRTTVSSQAPSAAVIAQVYAVFVSPAVGQPVYFDALQLEPGEIASAFARAPGEILPGEVGATQITPNSITSNQILAASILGTSIAASTITGTNIAASTITANKLSVTTLSAIAADMGTITAGTITGALIRTAASGARVELSGTSPIGLKKYDASGNVTVRIGQTEGLSLLSGTSSSPPGDRKLTWTRADTTTCSSLSSYSTNGADAVTLLEANPTSGTGLVSLFSGRQGFNPQAYIWISTGQSPSESGNISANVSTTSGGFKSVVIINEAGVSDFVQKTDTTTRAAFTFSNGWRAYLGGTGGAGSFGTNVGYFKDGSGVVHLEGLLDKNGGNWAANDVILTLPAGFRPPSSRMFRPEISPDGLGARVDLNTAGQLILVGGGATNPVGYLSLDGISFSTV